MRNLHLNEVADVSGGVVLAPWVQIGKSVYKFLRDWGIGKGLDWLVEHPQEAWDAVANDPALQRAVGDGASGACRYPSPTDPSCGS